MKSFIAPWPDGTPITFTFDQHKALAIKKGWQWDRGKSGVVYYYPGTDAGGVFHVNESCGGKVIKVKHYKAARGQLIWDYTKGKMVKAKGGEYFGWGCCVVVDQGDGYEGLYAHLNPDTLHVKIGDVIPQGFMIAMSDNTGNSTGDHLHWEEIFKGINTDPMQLVTMGGSAVVPDVYKPEVGKIGDVVIVAGAFYLRKTPVISNENKVCLTITEGPPLEVLAIKDDWIKVKTPAELWIHKSGIV